MFNRRSIAMLLLSLGLCWQVAQADEVETVLKSGDYDIHYSVVNTSFLTPQVAESYRIVRSKSKALVTIAVLKRDAKGVMHNVSAVVKGDVFDLIQRTALTFSEVREQPAIYYLAQIDIQHTIPVYFTVMVQPDPNNEPIKLTFKKTLYVDGK